MSAKKEEIKAPVSTQAEKAVAAKPAGNEPLTQREGVYVAVMRVLKSKNIEMKKGVAVQTLLTPELREALYKLLAQGFAEKRIALKQTESNQQKMADPKALQVYIIGLVNNWLRRDERLNGKE